MNIFKTLSLESANIREVNITSFFSYLLNKPKDLDVLFPILFFEYISELHSKNILTEYLNIKSKTIREKIISFNKNFNISVESEYALYRESKKQILDIFLKVSKLENEEDILYILIENKIKKTAKKDQQPADQFRFFLESEDINKSAPIISVLITIDDDGFTSVMDNLRSINSNSVWLKWTNSVRQEQSVEFYLKRILEYEKIADIQPLDFTTQFILKSFIDYISSEYSKKESFEKNLSINGAEVIENLLLDIDGYEFRLKRYSDNKIRLVDEKGEFYDGDIKPKLRRINEIYGLKVDLLNSNRNRKNTQQLGKDIIIAYKDKIIKK